MVLEGEGGEGERIAELMKVFTFADADTLGDALDTWTEVEVGFESGGEGDG